MSSYSSCSLRMLGARGLEVKLCPPTGRWVDGHLSPVVLKLREEMEGATEYTDGLCSNASDCSYRERSSDALRSFVGCVTGGTVCFLTCPLGPTQLVSIVGRCLDRFTGGEERSMDRRDGLVAAVCGESKREFPENGDRPDTPLALVVEAVGCELAMGEDWPICPEVDA